MPQVSVIIPLYNKAAHLRRTLDAVLAQTFTDFDVIVVDDGSTDDGPQIVRSYADPRIRLIQQPNAGPGAARNRGFAESNSPYVYFVDADDEPLPLFLEKTTQELDAHQECEACVTGMIRSPRNSVWNPGHDIPEGVWQVNDQLTFDEFFGALSRFSNLCTLWRRQVVARFGGFYDKYKCLYGEDRYLTIQVLLNCKIYRIREPLYIYHTEDSGLIYNNTEERQTHPLLLDPEPVRANCPAPFHKYLDGVLNHYAESKCAQFLLKREHANAKELLNRFPCMKQHYVKYLMCRLDCLVASASFGFAPFAQLRRLRSQLTRRLRKK